MRSAFDRVRGQVGACGIWCGSCAVGNGALHLLAERLSGTLETYGVEHWAPPDLDYPAFAAGLEAIRGIAHCEGCRNGGGRHDCEMRSCAASRGVRECAGCSNQTTCRHVEILTHMRDGARDGGLFVRAEARDDRALLSEWTARLKHRWPSCLLFLDGPHSHG